MSGRGAGGVAVVTGGGSGIGRLAARTLAAAGRPVAVVDIDRSRALEVAAEIGPTALAVQCDVSDRVAVDAAMATVVTELGQIGVLVNSAGLHLTRFNLPFGRLTADEIQSVFAVNVLGVVHVTQACVPSMRRGGGGSVINLSSISAFQPTSPYGVTKLAVRGLTIAFATELAADNIAVNAIAPGLTATEAALADLPPEVVEDLVQNRQLLHELCQPEDIVAMMTFLLSDGARMITGETFRVSGGYPLAI